MPIFSSNVLRVALTPDPPNSPNSFWLPCAMKIRPSGTRRNSGARRIHCGAEASLGHSLPPYINACNSWDGL